MRNYKIVTDKDDKIFMHGDSAVHAVENAIQQGVIADNSASTVIVTAKHLGNLGVKIELVKA